MKRVFFVLVLISCGIGGLAAGDKDLTVQAIFGGGAGRGGGRGTGAIRWMEHGARYAFQQFDTVSRSMNLFMAKTSEGTRESLLDVSTLKLAPDDPPFRFTTYQFSPDEQKILFVSAPPERQYLSRLTPAGNLFLYDRPTRTFRRLTNVPVPQYNQKFSPDGTRVGFVRENNIFVVDLATGVETQLTSDGAEHLINGRFDWVYEEEFGISDGWQWSPDGRSIAYWQVDERPEPEFHMMDYMTIHDDVIPMRYPKAGEANPVVKIGVVSVETKRAAWMDLGANTDVYVPRMAWSPDGQTLVIHRLNRLQNKLELLSANPSTGAARVTFTEQEKTWIEERYEMRFVGTHGDFLWISERDGYSHIYLFGPEGTLSRQVTTGAWDVSSIAAVDEAKKVVYFTGTVKSPLEVHLYRIGLDVSGPQQITREGFSHSTNLAPDMKHYVDSYSNVATPPRSAMYLMDGTFVRAMEENRPDPYAAYRLGEHTFFTFTTTDGVTLNGSMIKPPDFDAAKKHPVLFYVYGGPGSQTVLNSWGGSNYLWHQLLAEKGYIVVSVDGRGTGARGKAFKEIVYRKLGAWEVNDQVEAAKYLGTLPYVDKTRIGIWGWSYGGYMAALTLFKGADVFKSAVAVAPVTDWKFYDSIYGERYMGLPQENPDGYKESSPITHAGKLKGNLLIVHGTTDDNVHWQNTMQLVDALQKAGKQFRTMFYVDKNHGIAGGNTRVHLFEMLTDFIVERL